MAAKDKNASLNHRIGQQNRRHKQAIADLRQEVESLRQNTMTLAMSDAELIGIVKRLTTLVEKQS